VRRIKVRGPQSGGDYEIAARQIGQSARRRHEFVESTDLDDSARIENQDSGRLSNGDSR